MQRLGLLPLGVLVGWRRGIFGCCNVFKPGRADWTPIALAELAFFDAFPAQAVANWRDHPCQYKHSDKLYVPDDLQALWLGQSWSTLRRRYLKPLSKVP